MPGLLVQFKAILNDSCRDDVQPNMRIYKFVIQHPDADFIAKKIEEAFQRILVMRGMMIAKDETQTITDLNNAYFLPMHMIARIEFEVGHIIGNIPANVQGEITN